MARLTTISRQTGVTSGDAIRELGAATLGMGAGNGGSPSQLSPRSAQAPSQPAVEDKKRKGPFGFLGKARKSSSTLSIRRSSLESTAAGGDETPREAAAAKGLGDAFDGSGSGARQEKRGSGSGGSGGMEHGEADSLAEALMVRRYLSLSSLHTSSTSLRRLLVLHLAPASFGSTDSRARSLARSTTAFARSSRRTAVSPSSSVLRATSSTRRPSSSSTAVRFDLLSHSRSTFSN